MKKLANNNTEQVNSYLDKLNHPFLMEIEAVRKIIINANENMGEHIKWNAPSFFCIGGNDKGGMATIHTKNLKKIHLIFHNGAVIDDHSGFMEGVYIDRRMVYFHNMEDVVAKKNILEKAVNDWVNLIKSNTNN